MFANFREDAIGRKNFTLICAMCFAIGLSKKEGFKITGMIAKYGTDAAFSG
ncbi:MAG: hypothetical protein K0B01_03815 [Syntrophobacterales bacterium]|nr:hypothetical protein [Syntrophobacterales bacterium]